MHSGLVRAATLLGLLLTATPALRSQVFWENVSSVGVTDDLTAVACGNGVFAAVSAEGRVFASPDGQNWTQATIQANTALSSIAYGNGTWVAVGPNGIIFQSSDLKTWTAAVSGTTRNLNGVVAIAAYGVTFIALGDAGTLLTSNDGIDWNAQAVGTMANLYQAAFVPPGEIIVCGSGGTTVGFQGYQSDFSSLGTTADLNVVLENSAETVVYAGPGGFIEDDAAAGQIDLRPVTANLRAGSLNRNYFVLVGDQGTILTSPTGATWTRRFAGSSPDSLTTANLLGVAYSADRGLFVAVGSSGTTLTSSGGPSALVNVSARGIVAPGQPLIGGFVVQGSLNQSLLVRAVGPTLASFGVSDPLPDPVITIYDAYGDVVTANAGWNSGPPFTSAIAGAAYALGAFALPEADADSAVLQQFMPGAYTVLVTSAGGHTGTALFEIYSY